MALNRTGYTASTPQHYLLDAGAIYKNLTFTPGSSEEDGEWDGELLGATAEGSTLTIEPTYRVIEVDGPKGPTKGGRALEEYVAGLEANVKEITAENYRLSVNGTIRDAEADEAPAGYQVIEGKDYIEESDYEENIAYVGTLSGSDQPFIAILENPFVTSASEAEFADDSEAVIAMNFEASADADDVAAGRQPWKIFFPPLRS